MATTKKIGKKGKKGSKSKTNNKSDIKKLFSKQNINKLTNEFGPVNMDKLKSGMTIRLTANIVFAIILITIISLIINYLDKLNKCDCFINNNDENKSRITFLIVIEVFVLISAIILLLSSVMVLYLIKKGGDKYEGLYVYFMIFSAILLFIQLYFIYSVYELSKNIRDDCDCAKSWVRYLLYLQTISIAINVIFTISKFFIKK